jgi:HlyD family secretion protein
MEASIDAVGRSLPGAARARRATRWTAAAVVLLLAAAGGLALWRERVRTRLPDGIVESNGRLEAEQIQIATKLAGRVAEVLVDEGDTVDAGDVLARMDATEIRAQLRRARAEVMRAEQAKVGAEASIGQRESEHTLARQEFARALSLHETGTLPVEVLDQRRSQLAVAEAAYRVAVASLEQAKAAIESAEAEVARFESVVDDAVLRAPRAGRIEYRLAQPGEVVGAGASVLTLLDLSDVYMTVFLPARAAGPLPLGSEARLALDPVPEYVVPARVAFVASEAQFTPKQVETAEERDKLTFRVKLVVDPGLLRQYERHVKAGVRGVAYVRVREDAAWPERLAVKLPP